MNIKQMHEDNSCKIFFVDKLDSHILQAARKGLRWKKQNLDLQDFHWALPIKTVDSDSNTSVKSWSIEDESKYVILL